MAGDGACRDVAGRATSGSSLSRTAGALCRATLAYANPTLPSAPRRLLFGPGPSLVAPRVYEAMSQPVVGHLDPFFFEVADQVRALLGYAYSTANEFNLAVSGTGSAGMEAAVANFAEPGRKFALLTNGFFADRIGEMARRQGAEVVRLAKPWGEPFDPQEAREFIRREQPRVVAFVQAETSTGMYNQAKPICEAAHEVDALAIADCVTSLGGMPVLVDENGIDIAYSCTQKGLGCPPGLAPMTVSPRALGAPARRAPRRCNPGISTCCCWTPITPAASITTPLRPPCSTRCAKALAMVAEEGLENRWERHRRNHLAFVAGIEAMGLEMHVAGRTPPLDAEHAARAGGRERRQGAPVPAGRARHRDRRRIRSPGGQGLPHRPDGLRLPGRECPAGPGSAGGRPEAAGL